MDKSPEAVVKRGADNDVAAANVPVKFAALDIVCPLINPDVIVPIFVKFPVASILTVPAPAPVAIEVTALNVPGARKSEGSDKTTAPVVGEAVI
jgi:hypothetical protein